MRGFNLDYKKKRILLIIFSAIIIASVYFFKSSSFVLRGTSAIAIMVLFYGIDHFYNIKFKKRHYAFMLIIVVMSILASSFYYVYPNYDKVQHFIQPIFVCSLIFHLVNKLHLELKWKLLFTFSTTLAILGLFELGEFALDSLFNLKLQGVYLRDLEGFEKFNLIMDPLKDTMVDLLLGTLGSGIYTIIFGWTMRRKLNNNKVINK